LSPIPATLAVDIITLSAGTARALGDGMKLHIILYRIFQVATCLALQLAAMWLVGFILCNAGGGAPIQY
jgi:hypothetical protein